jgi:hypothetical protein
LEELIWGQKHEKNKKKCIFDPILDGSHPILDTPQIVNVNLGEKGTSRRSDPKLPTPY